MRNGFSLVEALVALALFQIAMLALAATTIVAARDIGSATRRSRALTIAAQRVEQMRLTACRDTPGLGALSVGGGYREHWRIDGAAIRSLSDSVTFPQPTGRESWVTARADVLCQP